MTTFVNPRVAQVLGYSVEEMTGVPLSVFAESGARASLSADHHGRSSGVGRPYRIELRAKDGAMVPVLVFADHFLDEDGEHAGALAMVTEMTPLREAEEILRSEDLRLPGGIGGDPPGREKLPTSESTDAPLSAP